MNETNAVAFMDVLLAPANLMIAGAVWTLIQAVRRLIPKLERHPFYVRAKPLASILLCSGAVWIPNVTAVALGTGERIMLGVVLGTMVGQMHKVIKQSGLGEDKRIDGGP